ncbi:hypothetical protein [Saccharopolyspora phatthalungensis]|uniref:Uncharacterized protein n=1 Tax=Saccharopolyspora phatthalungensis TaxID=664693 RepID=A0A840QG40_9PSEU|nr:hypothetical protein [Saccharopolyspora phatthalungensis]MBB5159426.1 hypothetical protein [Saccharopolyspora phatthalungensis]
MTPLLINVANNPVRIAPGLTLDSGLYDAAAAGVAEHPGGRRMRCRGP